MRQLDVNLQTSCRDQDDENWGDITTDARLFRGSDSVNRLLKNSSNEPFENLANAIICVAADDYRMAIIESNDKEVDALERFFKSEWYRALTDTNGLKLMRLLGEEAKETRRKMNRKRMAQRRREATKC